MLWVFLHKRQHDVADRVTDAITKLVPGRRVGRAYRRDSAVMIVSCCCRDWPVVFPQDGPGRKHTRRIVLESWQRDIVTHCPQAFLRGLLESDGGRHRRIVNGKDYPAYSFKNRSEDILGLCTWVCDQVGIRWRRSNRATISVARRPDVARLDTIMGLKPA